MDTEQETSGPQGGVAETAKGWHRLQLAVLGFIGLCGVIQAGADVPGPGWVGVVAGWLALGALLVACLATYLVGRVAWPLHRPGVGSDADAASVGASRARSLRWGVALTYVAVVAIVLAALANWWPGDDSDDVAAGGVRVTDVSGQSWCGRLVDAPPGALLLATDQGQIEVDGGTVAGIVSVDRC